MPERAAPTALLLAAGSGSRFGAHKLLAPLADGTPLGVASARHLRQVLARVLVVVRAGDVAARRLFETAGFATTACADAALGMGHSLAHGVDVTADSDGWLIALADMPFIAPDTLARLVEAYRASGAITVPHYRGQDGQPVIFPAAARADLLALRGDRGARAVITAGQWPVVRVAVCDPGVCRDIDHPTDLPV